MADDARYPARLRRHLIAEFKGALRELCERAGRPTFRTMSRRTGAAATTLWRAESGDSVPSLFTTLDYVEACDGDRRLWADQHRDLLVALNGESTSKPIRFVPWRDYFDQGAVPPPPPTVNVLRTEMRRMWITSGKTLQEIADRTAELRYIVGNEGLGVSTISELCNPDVIRVPHRRTLYAFLRAVEAPSESIERWLTARAQLAAKHDRRLNTTSRPRTKARRRPVSTADGAAIGDHGEQLMARLRRLSNEIGQAGTSTAVSGQRMRNVLSSLGVDPAIVVSVDPTLVAIFVRKLHQMTEDIMTEGNLPSSASSLALELAVSRVSNDYLQMRADTFAP
jgi:hypothetical protein